MKKIITFIFCLIFINGNIFSQSEEKNYTILFLLPLNADSVAKTDIAEVNTQMDINRFWGNTLIPFWEGAQLALSDIETSGRKLHIIVRDITNDIIKLQNTLHEISQTKVDLIIAPVYGKMFPTIAAFAKKHKIPTVNPMASRSDITENNPYIYKSVPSLQSRAAYLYKHYPQGNFILWYNTNLPSREAKAYITYFQKNNISFHTVNDSLSFKNHLSSTENNVVITCFDDDISRIHAFEEILSLQNMSNFEWIIPQKWVQAEDFNVNNLSGMNVYYFTNYYIDETAENTELFRYNYIERFHSIPTLENYSFLGYDVTYFFTELIANDFMIPHKFIPLSTNFDFSHIPNGGYENMGIHFIQIQDYNFIDIK